MNLHLHEGGGGRDNTRMRILWERGTGGTVTLDESVRPPLWRARDDQDRELVQAHDLRIVMEYLDRLAVAAARRAAFGTQHPGARFWTSASDAGPLRYHGSLPVGADRVESGPHRELGALMDCMDALAARAAEMRAK